MRQKYRFTSLCYDILDYPWERQYRRWRPTLLSNLSGKVLELGAGTGRNLAYYPEHIELTAVDQSDAMLKHAKQRAKKASYPIQFVQADATQLGCFPDNHFDSVVATFLYCVMPDELQLSSLQEVARVLKPGGQFKFVEMLYSQQNKLRRRQRLFSPFVKKIYGAQFDRQTLYYLHFVPELEITQGSFLKDDTYLLIEGRCIETDE